MSDLNNDQGPASGAHPGHFEGESQRIGDGYDQMTNSQNDPGMGGGAGAHGSGVAGGYEGNQQQPAEKQDWLDKGLQFASNKVGYNLSNNNADKAGDFINKEFSQEEGRKLPGVQ